MKPKLFQVILLFTIFILSSCSKGSKLPSHVPFKESSSDNWGMITFDGKVLFADEFSNTPTSVFNGRFFVKNNEGYWEMYAAEENPKQIGEEYEQACVFTADVTPVLKKGKNVIEVIDKDGKTRFNFEKVGNKKVISMSGYNDDIAIFALEDESVGAVDTKGNVVIDPKYCLLTSSHEGRLMGIEMKDKDSEKYKVFVLNIKGEKLFSIDASKYTPCVNLITEDLLPITNGTGCGLMNMKGEVTLKPNEKIKNITSINDGKFIFSDGYKWGLKSIDGTTLIRPKYSLMSFTSNGNALLVKDDNSKCYLINVNGEKIGSNTFDGFYTFNSCAFNIVKTGKSYSFIDSNGEFMKNAPEIYDFMTTIADPQVKIAFNKPQEFDNYYTEDGDTIPDITDTLDTSYYY